MTIAFGPGIIGTIQLRDRYFDSDLATGNDDGSTVANAWQSLASMVAGTVRGDLVHAKKAAVAIPVTVNTDFPIAHDNAAWMIQGYGTEPGDGIKCVFACAIGGLIIEVNPGNIVVDCSFVGTAVTSYTVLKNAGNATFIRCAFSSDSSGDACHGTEGAFIACTFDNTFTFISSGAEAMDLSSGCVVGCKMQGEGVVLATSHADEGDVNFAIGNVVISDSLEARDCIQTGGGNQTESGCICVVENSVWGGSRGIHVEDFPASQEFGTVIMYNILSGCDIGLDATDTGNQEWTRCVMNNAFGNNTTSDIGSNVNADMAERIVSLTLTGDPYATTTALDLDSTANEGLPCRSTGILGYIGGSGNEVVTGAFSYGAHREGVDDSGDSDALVGFSQQAGGGAGLAGKDFGLLPLNKTSDIG